MKLLQYPHDRDPYLVRIDKMADILAGDDSSDYLDELLLVIINHVRGIPRGQYPEIDKVEERLTEARAWLWEAFDNDPEEEHGKMERE